MNLHEFQVKEIFHKYGIPVLPGYVAETTEQAVEAFRKLGSPLAIIKSQTHAGGRGKGKVYDKDLRTLRFDRGIALVRSADEAGAVAAKILGGRLVTKQTGPAGRVVRRVYVEGCCDTDRELYLGCVLDHEVRKPVFMVSKQGGMDIEEVAAKDPNAIAREHFDVDYGLRPFQARRLGHALNLSGEAFNQFVKLATALAKMYVACDCSLLEINPLAISKQGAVIALDGKMGIDDRAIKLKRQPEIEMMRDVHEEDPLEHESASHGLNYVTMEGNIGCMVNGAGLAMATMDIIKQAGGAPLNFLDVGGGANKDQVKKAFKLLLANPDVRAIFINIFGGILQCDVLAQGVVDAVKEIEVKIPVVVRLEGSNVEKGGQILKDSGLDIIPAADMADGAKKAIEAAGLRA